MNSSARDKLDENRAVSMGGLGLPKELRNQIIVSELTGPTPSGASRKLKPK